MNGYLLDTHIWLWHLGGDPALPPGIRETIERRDEELWLSPVSVWEVGLLRRKRRIDLKGRTLREWLAHALDRYPLREAPLTVEIATAAEEVDLHADPADRFLAATTLVHDLVLLTVDPRLVEADWLPTRSA